MKNKKLLRQALEIIKHSNTWDQKTWGEDTPCGFCGCLIGHVIQLKWKTARFGAFRDHRR